MAPIHVNGIKGIQQQLCNQAKFYLCAFGLSMIVCGSAKWKKFKDTGNFERGGTMEKAGCKKAWSSTMPPTWHHDQVSSQQHPGLKILALLFTVQICSDLPGHSEGYALSPL